MPFITKCLKFSIAYVLLTFILLDMYLIFLKPLILPDRSILRNTGMRVDTSKEIEFSCLSKEREDAREYSKQYLLEHKASLYHKTFAKRMEKTLISFALNAWDRLFILIEELETIVILLTHFASSVLTPKQNNPEVVQLKGSSEVSKLHGYQLFRPIQDSHDSSKVDCALSVIIQKNILQKNVKIHASSQEDTFINTTMTNGQRKGISIDLRREANATLKVAKEFMRLGNLNKAKKLLEHARALDPLNAEVTAAYGEVFERRKPPDYVLAEHYYGKALLTDPDNEKVRASRRRTLPLVEQIDQSRFNRIDQKVYQYYHIPEGHPGLRRLKKEHYYRYVYHSNAIEGNTLSLAQTRAILETRIAVGGKSVFEHNEVLGLDAALKYLNSTLLRKQGPFTMADILEIHRRVLGFVDLQEAGRLRDTQVFIADFQPPPAKLVPSLMTEFLAWLNSDETQDLHPVELAALAHWKLVFIHPFYDGNGRTARLLMNLILMRAGYPPAIVRVEERALYYQLIREANEGDVRPFIRFIAHCTEITIDEFISTAKNVINFEGSVSEPMDVLTKARVINL